jgi:hypothetical protein
MRTRENFSVETSFLRVSKLFAMVWSSIYFYVFVGIKR